MTLRRIFARLEDFFNIALILIAFGLIAVDLLGALIPIDTYLGVMTAALAALLWRAMRPAQAPPRALDDILQDRNGYVGSIRDFIGDGRDLWVYAPSAVNTMAQIAWIRETLLRARRGQVRFLIQDPEKLEAVALLTEQLHDQMTNFSDDCARSIKIMRECRAVAGLEYRLAPSSPGYGLTIVDAHSPQGRLSVEFLGYKNESIERRMHIIIARADSPKWFDYYVDQFEKLWTDSREDAG